MAHFPADGDLRALARQIQHENDPYKMIELAEQLLEILDEEVLRQSARPASNVE